MSVANLGDLSHSYFMRQRNVALREEIARLTAELASGRVADTREVLAGNNDYLTDIERRMEILQGYGVSTSEARLFTDALQNALTVIDDVGGDLTSSLLISGTSATAVAAPELVREAEGTLASIVAAINTESAGRFLFSGAATDQPALPAASDIIDALRTATAGAADPAALLAAADTWFADPAGFAATVYGGSDSAMTPFGVSPTDQVTLDVRAIDPRVMETIKLVAVTALAEDPSYGFTADEQTELFASAAEAMMGAQDGLTAVRADVGFAQARIDKIAARNAAEVTSMEFAKLALLEVDPFEAATRLEEAQFQLQSLYSVTVRMSQLSLANYL